MDADLENVETLLRGIHAEVENLKMWMPSIDGEDITRELQRIAELLERNNELLETLLGK